MQKLPLKSLHFVTLTLLSLCLSSAKSNIPNMQMSAQFVRLSDGKVLWEESAQTALSPASVTKLVTAAAVLAKFTPQKTFSTKIYADARPSAKVLKGNIYMKGDGDPFLVSEKLWQLAADMKNAGLKTVQGDLVIDDSLFDGEARDESREEGEDVSSYAYDAPISALGVNFNTVALVVSPAAKVGAPALVAIDPYPIDGIRIQNKATTVAGESSSLKVTRVTSNDGTEALNVAGKIGVGKTPQKIYRSLGNANTLSGRYIKAFFANEGIQIKGKVRMGGVPASALNISSVDSYEMQKLVSGLNKFSNNYIADVMVKRVGAAFGSPNPDQPQSGSLASGTKVITQFLQEDVGIKTPMVIKNGSGLNTENRLSAAQIVSLLRYMEQRLDLFPEFLVSLPAAGWDGTLSKRFSDSKFKGMVRAKTGTLSQPISVSSLAGYFRSAEHGLVAFAIIQNGVAGKSQPPLDTMRNQQDELLHEFLK